MRADNIRDLGALISAAAAEHGNAVFIRQKAGTQIVDKTYSEFLNDVKKLCSYMKPLGKIHAAIIGATSYSYLVSWFGTAAGGNVIVPLDAQLLAEDVCDLVKRSDSTVFFYDGRLKKIADAVKAECPEVTRFICLDGIDDGVSLEDILESTEPCELPAVSPDSMAAIVYTSGTTGKSKGVMLSHGNYIDNTFCCDGEAEEGDVLLSILPIHHVYCFTCDILLSFRYGTTICVNDSMMRIAQNLKLFSPTIILVVPMIAATIYKQICAAAAAKPELPKKAIAAAVFGGRLKGIYSGGAYLPPEIIAGYAELGIPIAQGYGMTECSPRISSIRFGDGSFGDVGIIVGGCVVKIVDGEIVVKSPSVMKGYYKDEAATAEAIDSEGWLHTGDLGYVENNRIFITGRKKNLIILSNGENVSPEELENKFATIDFISEVMVYAEDGVITAELFPNPDAAASMDREDICRRCHEIIDAINKTVPSSKTIRRIRLRDSGFDKTPSRKIKRNQTSKGEVI